MDKTSRKGKATHRGHCQACGRLQMLPNGVLSLHGYNVAHGYFSGTCVGSKELPFEKSCELVKLFIQQAQTQLASVEEFQAKLNLDATEPKAYFHTSHPSKKGWGYGKDHRWAECSVREEVVPFSSGDGSYSKFYRTGDTTQRKGGMDVTPIEREIQYQYSKTLLEVCTEANRTYAGWLEHEADSLRRYIAWQTERVRTWKEADLFPLTHEDTLGFKPTEPRY